MSRRQNLAAPIINKLGNIFSALQQGNYFLLFQTERS